MNLTFLGAAGEVIAFVLLSRAPIDHSGLLPRLSILAAQALLDQIRRKGWSAQVASACQAVEIA